MKPFSEWSVVEKAMTSFLGTVVLLGGALATVPVFEPYAPATHSFVRDLLQQAQATDTIYQAKINQSLIDNTVGILDLKLVAIDGQLDALNNQLNMIILKLADPQGADRDLLTGLRDTLNAQIKEKTAERNVAACDKQLAEFPGTSCSR